MQAVVLSAQARPVAVPPLLEHVGVRAGAGLGDDYGVAPAGAHDVGRLGGAVGLERIHGVVGEGRRPPVRRRLGGLEVSARVVAVHDVELLYVTQQSTGKRDWAGSDDFRASHPMAAIYSDVDINFQARNLTSVTSLTLDSEKVSRRSSGDLPTEINQLLIAEGNPQAMPVVGGWFHPAGFG